MKQHTGKLVRALIVTVVVAGLILFARTVEWAETWRAIKATSPAVLAAAALVNLVSITLKAARWHVFLRPVGVDSPGLTLRATFAGAALNNILIANSGEAARVVFVSRASHVPSDRILATLALERLFEMFGFVVLLTLSVSLLQLPPALASTRPYAIVVLVLMLGFILYLARRPEKAELPAIEGEGLLHRAREYGRGFLRTLTGISTGRRFAVAMAITVAVWGTQVATYHLTVMAAHFDLPLVGTVATLLAVNLGFAVRATPGNVGVFQMVYAVTAAAFGMDRDAAIAVGLLIQAQQILPVIALGLLAAPEILREHRRHSARQENILPGEPAPGSES